MCRIIEHHMFASQTQNLEFTVSLNIFTQGTVVNGGAVCLLACCFNILALRKYSYPQQNWHC